MFVLNNLKYLSKEIRGLFKRKSWESIKYKDNIYIYSNSCIMEVLNLDVGGINWG